MLSSYFPTVVQLLIVLPSNVVFQLPVIVSSFSVVVVVVVAVVVVVVNTEITCQLY